MKVKQHIPTYGYYIIGTILLSILTTCVALKLTSNKVKLPVYHSYYIAGIREDKIPIKKSENKYYIDGNEVQRWVYDEEKVHLAERRKIRIAEITKEQAEERIQQSAARGRDRKSKELQNSFSAWDGSHKKLEKYIKSRLRDPSSYEHIDTTYEKRGSSVMVQTVFRAKNGFGGMTEGNVIAETSGDGTILNIISENTD